MKTDWFSSTSNVTLCCLQASSLEGRSAHFMCIKMKTPSDPSGLLSGQTRKPNSIIKAGAL